MTEGLKHFDSPVHAKDRIQENPEGKQTGIFGIRSKIQRKNNLGFSFELGSPRRTELEIQESSKLLYTYI